MFNIIKTATFSCPRTCTPGHLCQFMPVLAAIGAARVMSHTVRVTVQIENQDALKAAIVKLGGVIHHGTGKDTRFTIPSLGQYGNVYVTFANGQFAYDEDYGEAWIKALTERYAIEAARQAADAQGWISEDQEDGSLVIHHPNGGAMTVQADGTVDAIGFIGTSCDVAKVIELAIGTPGDRDDKPEYFGHGTVQI